MAASSHKTAPYLTTGCVWYCSPIKFNGAEVHYQEQTHGLEWRRFCKEAAMSF